MMNEQLQTTADNIKMVGEVEKLKDELAVTQVDLLTLRSSRIFEIFSREYPHGATRLAEEGRELSVAESAHEQQSTPGNKRGSNEKSDPVGSSSTKKPKTAAKGKSSSRLWGGHSREGHHVSGALVQGNETSKFVKPIIRSKSPPQSSSGDRWSSRDGTRAVDHESDVLLASKIRDDLEKRAEAAFRNAFGYSGTIASQVI